MQENKKFENLKDFIDEMKLIPNFPNLKNIFTNINIGYGEEFLYQRGLGTRNLMYLLRLFGYFQDNDKVFNLLCIEEPEAHLCVNNFNLVLDFMNKSAEVHNDFMQLLITSHNPKVINKLKLNNVVILTNQKAISLDKADKELVHYLAKRPNYDILKVLFAKRLILVEGPTEYIVFRAKEDIDADFIYYLVRSQLVREPAIKSMVGSSGRQRVQIDVLQNLVLAIPSFEEQKKIAGVLKVLDDKIALNRKVNDNLQQQATLLFKEKFGLYIYDAISLPRGWYVDEISNLDVLVTDYVANGSFKSLANNVHYLSEETNNVLIRLTDHNNNYSADMVYISNDSYELLAKSKLYGDEIIISNVGANVGTVFRCPRLSKGMSLAPNSIMFRSEKLEHYLYFTSSFGQQLLQSIVTGSAQPKFNKTNFRSLKIVVPDEDTLLAFNNLYAPMHEMLVTNNIENAHLIKVRDSLLPKLMFGDIDVSDIEF